MTFCNQAQTLLAMPEHDWLPARERRRYRVHEMRQRDKWDAQANSNASMVVPSSGDRRRLQSPAFTTVERSCRVP